MDLMESREFFGKIVLTPGVERMKRLGVDVGGTFTDLIYVDDESRQGARPQAADDAGGSLAGHGPGDPAS